jgi:hypothetical protein
MLLLLLLVVLLGVLLVLVLVLGVLHRALSCLCGILQHPRSTKCTRSSTLGCLTPTPTTAGRPLQLLLLLAGPQGAT